MTGKLSFIPGGTVTTPKGFLAGATYVGLKTAGEGKLDLGLLLSPSLCSAAGVFTRSKIKAAPVTLSQEHLRTGNPRCIIVNSGCANACTGAQGMSDAREMARLAADLSGVEESEALVASTGVIGVNLNMGKLRTGFKNIKLSPDGGHELARAIMTTDTAPKEVAVAIEHEGVRGVIAGIAKGSGMIHPNMATLLSFITTDLAVNEAFLRRSLHAAVDNSFNMITVDGDTSTNDTVFVLANGASGLPVVTQDSPLAADFAKGLEMVCMELAKAVAKDGEGATKFIEVQVEGALNRNDARMAARTVAGSMLVKTAVYGEDPNWGRVLAAVGRSGAEVVESRVELLIGQHQMLRHGQPVSFDVEGVRKVLAQPEVTLTVRLNLGLAQATAWGCDLTEEYVTFNSAYTT